MLAIEEKPVQTTVRAYPSKLREAQYYLSLKGISLSQFFAESLDHFLEEHRKAHPERVPVGAQHDPESSQLAATAS